MNDVTPGENGASRSPPSTGRSTCCSLFGGGWSAHGADLGVTEISAELGLSKAAVHRILTSLRSRDLVCVDECSRRRYSLGPCGAGPRAGLPQPGSTCVRWLRGSWPG